MKSSAFSLIELLIVLTMVAILSCIAYPCYTRYLIKARRTNAIVVLLNLAAGLEQYYNGNHSYQGATLVNLGIKKVDVYYRFKIVLANDTNFKIKATPTGTQATADHKCGCLIVDQLGNRNITGTGDVNECWG